MSHPTGREQRLSVVGTPARARVSSGRPGIKPGSQQDRTITIKSNKGSSSVMSTPSQRTTTTEPGLGPWKPAASPELPVAAGQGAE